MFFNVRSDEAKQCILVIIGAKDTGEKEFVAIEDGYRESEQSWYEVLLNLRYRGLTIAPKLTIGDGAMGFWGALAKVFPETKMQRCWVHKTAKTRGCVSRSTILAMVFKLGESAQKRWQRLRGYRRLPEVVRGVKFVDGIAEDETTQQEAA